MVSFSRPFEGEFFFSLLPPLGFCCAAAAFCELIHPPRLDLHLKGRECVKKTTAKQTKTKNKTNVSQLRENALRSHVARIFHRKRSPSPFTEARPAPLSSPCRRHEWLFYSRSPPPPLTVSHIKKTKQKKTPPCRAKLPADALDKNANETLEQRAGPLRLLCLRVVVAVVSLTARGSSACLPTGRLR